MGTQSLLLPQSPRVVLPSCAPACGPSQVPRLVADMRGILSHVIWDSEHLLRPGTQESQDVPPWALNTVGAAGSSVLSLSLELGRMQHHTNTGALKHLCGGSWGVGKCFRLGRQATTREDKRTGVTLCLERKMVVMGQHSRTEGRRGNESENETHRSN